MNNNQVKTKKQKQKQTSKAILAQGKTKIKAPSQSKDPMKRVGKNIARALNLNEQETAKYVQELVLSFTLPGEVKAKRLGSLYGSYETAVANVFALCNPAWSANNATGFLFRDPCRFFICPFLLGAGAQGTYSYTYSGYNISTYQAPLLGFPLKNTSGSSYHGPLLYPGRIRGQQRSWYYCHLGVISLSNPTAQSLVVTLWADYGGSSASGSIIQTTTVGPGVDFNYVVSTAGYFAIDIYATGPSTGVDYTGTLSITETSGSSRVIYAHKAMPDLNIGMARSRGIKLYGASLLFTNEASPLNRQGKLAAVQMPAATDWRPYTTYDAISPLKEAYTAGAQNGYYGFLKTTSPKDYEFQNNYFANATGVTQMWWDKEIPNDWLALAVQVTDLNGQDAVFKYSAAFEYRTNDQWSTVDKPEYSEKEVEMALELVSLAPQHFENPLHWGDIVDWVKNAAKSVVQGVNDILPFALKVGHAVAPIVAAMV
jgi:hypothetical protein